MAIDTFSVPGAAVFPEGITEGGGSTFYVGSLGDGTLFRGDAATGVVEVLLPPDGDGRVSTAGLAIDGAGRLVSCDINGGQLFVHDPVTRTLIARRPLPAEKAQPNDVAIIAGTAYVTDSSRPVVWALPLPDGEPSIAVDLAGYGAADDSYLNGIVADPVPDADSGAGRLLVVGQGSGLLWSVDLAARHAAVVDLGGYDFDADGLLLDGDATHGDLLYGVTNRGESMDDATFMITAVRLSPDRRHGTVLGEITDPRWDTPTTIAKVAGRLLVVDAQLRARRAGTPPRLPFQVLALDLPVWTV